MRSLALHGVSQHHLKIGPDSSISATALDLDQNAVYVATERRPDESSVEVDVWRIGGGDNEEGPTPSKVCRKLNSRLSLQLNVCAIFWEWN